MSRLLSFALVLFVKVQHVQAMHEPNWLMGCSEGPLSEIESLPKHLRGFGATKRSDCDSATSRLFRQVGSSGYIRSLSTKRRLILES